MSQWLLQKDFSSSQYLLTIDFVFDIKTDSDDAPFTIITAIFTTMMFGISKNIPSQIQQSKKKSGA